jgi:hypothetical protein
LDRTTRLHLILFLTNRLCQCQIVPTAITALLLATSNFKVGKIFVVRSDKSWKQLVRKRTDVGREYCWEWDCVSGGGTGNNKSECTLYCVSGGVG